MYQKIVVPLDGSKLAERVLPYIEDLAKGCNTEEVILLSVTERIIGRTLAPEVREVYGSNVPLTIGKKQSQALRYLARKAKQLNNKGIEVQTKVLLGNPAQEIIGYAEQNNCDLIALTSHGRSGIDRWAHSIGAYGSVAEKVIRASTLPVLIVPARE